MILLERLRDSEHAQVYTEMLEKCEADIADTQRILDALENLSDTIKKRKSELKSSIELMDDIIAQGAVSDANLRMLVDKIIIYENDERLQIEIVMKAAFRRHLDLYDDDGNISDKLFEIVELPFCDYCDIPEENE